MTGVTDTLKKIRAASTLCLINYDSSTKSLAYWCSDWKRWTYYSSGEFVKIEVTNFSPLASTKWNSEPCTMTESVTCIVQLESGRYTLAYKYQNVWYTKHTRREIQGGLLRAASIECMKPGSFKDV